VRVDQRREREYAEIAQHFKPARLGTGSDRPLGAVVLIGVVEVVPDLVHHRLGQEVHVQVDQAGQAQRTDPARDLLVRSRAANRDGPCSSAPQPW